MRTHHYGAPSTVLRAGLGLLAVLGLIFTSLVLYGYSELRQGEMNLENGEFSDAASHFERSAQLLPWRPELWEKAGKAQFIEGNFHEAIPLFERANERDALSAEGWDWLGQSYWQTGDTQSAQASWTAGIQAYPSYAKYHAQLSVVYFESGDTAAEQKALLRWLESGAEIPARAHYRLGQLLMLSDLAEAREQLIGASSLEPEFDPGTETLLTTIDLASLESDQTRRLIIIGRGLGLVGEWRLAKQAFQEAVTADGLYAEAWAWLGEAEQQLGLDGRAELDQALSLGRQNPIVRSLRGLYWTRQEKFEQALAEYLLAAEYDPENPAWQYSLGEIYAMLGDLPPALSRYQRATQIAPTDATTWRLLADFCARYNMQIEEIGLSAAQRAVRLGEDDPRNFDTLGQTLILLERLEEAKDILERAIALDPNFASGYLRLGVVASLQGDWPTAKTHWQMAHDLDPNGPAGDQAQVLLDQYFP